MRTLVDLAPTQRPREFERLCAQALVLNLVTQSELDGARIIDPDLAAPTRSKFERTFRAALRKAGLPPPVTGHPIPPYTADFAWPEEQVIVETDGWEFHGNRIAFEGDRARDAFLAARRQRCKPACRDPACGVYGRIRRQRRKPRSTVLTEIHADRALTGANEIGTLLTAVVSDRPAQAFISERYEVTLMLRPYTTLKVALRLMAEALERR